jgi:phage terminase small subunit
MAETPLDRIAPQLATFAQLFAETGLKKESAIKAGVHEARAPIWAAQALNNPEVRAAVDHCIRARFALAVPKAQAFVISLLEDQGADKRLRFDAAKDIMSRGGFAPGDIKAAAAAVKDLHELSPDELRAMLNETESELANRAKAIEVAPQLGASSLQVIDMEG